MHKEIKGQIQLSNFIVTLQLQLELSHCSKYLKLQRNFPTSLCNFQLERKVSNFRFSNLNGGLPTSDFKTFQFLHFTIFLFQLHDFRRLCDTSLFFGYFQLHPRKFSSNFTRLESVDVAHVTLYTQPRQTENYSLSLIIHQTNIPDQNRNNDVGGIRILLRRIK